MAADLVVVSLILLVLVACAIGGWWLAETRVRELEHDLDVALGWHERRTLDDAVVHPTLHMLDGGDA